MISGGHSIQSFSAGFCIRWVSTIGNFCRNDRQDCRNRLLSRDKVLLGSMHACNSLNSFHRTGVDLLEWVYAMKKETQLSP
jgi:hypothetical protein